MINIINKLFGSFFELIETREIIPNQVNIIIEDLTEQVSENLFFTLLNIIEQDNKYLIVTSTEPIVDFNFKPNPNPVAACTRAAQKTKKLRKIQ